MDLISLFSHRESVRSFNSSSPLPESVLQKIAEAGRLAPSAANRQPWRFLFVSSPQLLSDVKATYPRQWFDGAPHVLVVVADRQKAWTRADGYNSIETDATIAMDYMILMAESLGVGTCWVANFDADKLAEVLRLSPSEKVFAITPLGYPANDFIKSEQKNRKPLSDIFELL